MLAQSIQETLQRYALTLSLLQRNQQIDGEQLAADSQMMAMRLATLHGIHAPEFNDQSLFRTLLHSLRQQGGGAGRRKAPLQVDAAAVTALLATLLPLLPDPVRRTIQHLG